MRMGRTVEHLLQPLKQGVVQGVHLPTGGTWGTLKVEGMLDRFLSGLPSGGVSTTHDGSLVDLEKYVGSSNSGLSANALHTATSQTMPLKLQFNMWDKYN